VSLDGAAFADCTNEATEIGTSGVGYIDLTAAEMNADSVVLKITVTNTGAVPLVFTFCPETAGDYRVADTQKVDVETIKTQAVTCAAGVTVPSVIASTTNITAGTITTTTNLTNLPAITANWLTAAGLAADAVTEIQSGLATQTSVDTIQSDTNDIQTRLPAALEGGRIAAALDSASRLAIWNTLTTETFTADSFGDLLIISDGTNGRAVKVTGANHIAADVHDCQADGLSASTEIAAINTFATRVTTGLVQDGAVYQFTANMLELAPSGGGGSSVNVLPATGIVADRSAGATLVPVVGETISQSITLYRTDGTTAISLSGKTLAIVFETLSGVDVATVASGSITISGASSNIVTFAYPSAVTASERTLRFAIRDAAAPSTLYMQGVCSVVRAPQVDA
jgi:hypothetical protein